MKEVFPIVRTDYIVIIIYIHKCSIHTSVTTNRRGEIYKLCKSKINPYDPTFSDTFVTSKNLMKFYNRSI